jgi:hypothetical protein
MKTWAKVTIGIGAALAVVGGGFGLYKWLKSEEHEEKKEEDNANNPNKDVKNPEKVVGKEVYTETGANLRFENYVDNKYPTNLIASNFRGVIGTLENVSKADKDEAPDDFYDWYYVKLQKPIEVAKFDMTTRASSGEHTHCWVRSDNVKIR